MDVVEPVGVRMGSPMVPPPADMEIVAEMVPESPEPVVTGGKINPWSLWLLNVGRMIVPPSKLGAGVAVVVGTTVGLGVGDAVGTAVGSGVTSGVGVTTGVGT